MYTVYRAETRNRHRSTYEAKKKNMTVSNYNTDNLKMGYTVVLRTWILAKRNYVSVIL